MKIALLSDTHGRSLDSLLADLLRGGKPDLLLHAGDLADDHTDGEPGNGRYGCGPARELQALSFLRDWNAAAEQLDCPIVLVPGNHDFFLAWPPPERNAPAWHEARDWNFHRRQDPARVPPGWVPLEIERELDPRVKILNGSGVRTKGLRLWGSPWTPQFSNWAYNFAPTVGGGGQDAARHWAQIPADIDVLITHGPPYGILDEVWQGKKSGGCPFLRAELDSGRIKPRLHVFGHIHGQRGRQRRGETLFVNAAMAGRAGGIEVVEV